MATFRKRNNKWEFTMYTGDRDATGKRERIYKGGFKTKKEAEKTVAIILNQLEKGTYVKPDKLTVSEYMDKWLKEYAQTNVRYSTYKRYEQIIRVQIKPYMGHIELGKLNPLTIQEFYTYCKEKLNNSATSIRHYHSLLHKALNQAVKWRLISVNPVEAVEAPKKEEKQLQVYDQEQLNNLLERIKGMSVYYPVMLAATTGMRLGEIAGLTWDNVDLDKGIIYVKTQLQEVNGHLEVLPLKSKSSNRKIVLLDFTIKELKRLRIEQKENKLKYGEYYTDSNFVICIKETGLPYTPQYISRNFRRVLKEYGVCKDLNIPYIRFHDLRHTHATLMLKANIHPKIVAERLGHSTINLTLNTYSHVLPDMQQEAINKLNDIMCK